MLREHNRICRQLRDESNWKQGQQLTSEDDLFQMARLLVGYTIQSTSLEYISSYLNHDIFRVKDPPLEQQQRRLRMLHGFYNIESTEAAHNIIRQMGTVNASEVRNAVEYGKLHREKHFPCF